jgi:hypothetical protein
LRRCASAVAARLAAAALLACSVSSPETEVKEALAHLRELELPAQGPDRPRLRDLRFADVTVSMDGPHALVLAVVEAEGTADGGATLAYVGREAFPMERCARARWCLADLPALSGVLAALRAAPRDAGARVAGWQIRVERERATAGEDYDAGGRRLRLRRELRRDGAAWRLVAAP